MEIKWKEIKISEILNVRRSLKNYDDITYHKLKNQIKKNGQLMSILVFKSNDGYIVISGYSIYKVMKDIGKKNIFACVVSGLSEKELNLLGLEMNIKFRDDIVKIAKCIKMILKDYSAEEISITTDFYEKEIEDYPKILDYDFKKYDVSLHNNLFLEGNNEYF